jgi:hypothetical protein
MDDANEVVRKLAIALLDFQKKYQVCAACYLINYFMKWYLHEEFNLELDVNCGFIYNQSDDLYVFHAWSVFENKQIDVTGYFPGPPDDRVQRNKRADVIILDEVYEKGEVPHVYTLDDTLAEAKFKAKLGVGADIFGLLWIHSKQEQDKMRSISHDLNAIYQFVSECPYFANLLNEVKRMPELLIVTASQVG